jgi:hypothetical protein
MYDAVRAAYEFACPRRGEAHVSLSAFRRVERLPGAVHPALYRVRFACACGEEHLGLVAHDDLDWAPLGGSVPGRFVNLMTAHAEAVADELLELSLRRLRAGEWPWSFFCYPEERPREAYPSAFSLLALSGSHVAVAVACPACACTSINLVSPAHLDVPFHNDRQIGVVEHVFRDDVDASVEAFRAELHSTRFDARRLELD